MSSKVMQLQEENERLKGIVTNFKSEYQPNKYYPDDVESMMNLSNAKTEFSRVILKPEE
jgi:hypothetical protein